MIRRHSAGIKRHHSSCSDLKRGVSGAGSMAGRAEAMAREGEDLRSGVTVAGLASCRAMVQCCRCG